MSTKKDNPEEIRTAHQWLSAVAEGLDLDFQAMKPMVGELLDLTAGVAHGPSRPAAPLTTFLVGAATGQALKGEESNQEIVALIKEKTTVVEALLDTYRQQNEQED